MAKSVDQVKQEVIDRHSSTCRQPAEIAINIFLEALVDEGYSIVRTSFEKE